MAATTKRKKVSKKSKKSWKKHSDIKDVEESLVEARREERTDGPPSEKPDESLFFVEKETKEIPKSGKSKVRSRKRKPLMVDQLLLPASKIKPITSKKRKIQGKKTQIDSLSDSSDSDVESEKKRRTYTVRENKTQATQWFDLWQKEDAQNGDEHFLRTTGRKRIKKPKTINRKTSDLEAIEVCVPGASYNPTFEDHQSLLETAHHVESKKVEKMKKLDRKLQLLTPEQAANLPTWTEEMSQGLFAEDSKDEDERESDTNEGVCVVPVRAVDAKTKRQRRKQKEHWEREKRFETAKKEKIRQNEIFRLKTFKKEIRMAEQKVDERRRKKQERKKELDTKPKRLSRHRYEAPNIELKLSEEITGNLRTLKQEGNLFRDRFKSLQRRNIVEARKLVKPHRRYKKKIYTRRSCDTPCIKEL
ncbi:ribosome biogenesis protein NOP53-like [Montipora foliosa]|uniref:ribosome biogenesis protein NOP53-like n=1 Tax=Montipora foliosa TaxID=591990 RepID=UPI0035F1274E